MIVQCPHCRMIYDVKSRAKKSVCPNCGGVMAAELRQETGVRRPEHRARTTESRGEARSLEPGARGSRLMARRARRVTHDLEPGTRNSEPKGDAQTR
jgi:predicted  nucleic acid-binding Zn-ribbon protein